MSKDTDYVRDTYCVLILIILEVLYEQVREVITGYQQIVLILIILEVLYELKRFTVMEKINLAVLILIILEVLYEKSRD